MLLRNLCPVINTYNYCLWYACLTVHNASLAGNEEIPTFLHFAAKYGFHELCSLLLESIGATVACQVKNSHGQTPAEMAQSAGHNHVANLLADFQVSLFSNL